MRSNPISERAALVALLRTSPEGMTWPEIALRVLSRGSALQVWEECAPLTLIPTPGVSDPLRQAAGDLRAWTAEGLTVRCILDADYPRRLAGIHQSPPVLFALGRLLPDDRAVSIVGSRDASPHGVRLAAEVAHNLAEQGLTVLSGLATGVDTAAHLAALAAGGRTVAVIGTGIRRVYPASNRELQRDIGQRGLVLSQFWPDAPPRPQHFPMRNATMSGYGLATVVIEAGERSGARIQARLAVEHGRPVVLTQAVVDATTWAKQLLGRPHVHLARNSTEVMEQVIAIERESRELDGLVRALADA